MRAFLLPLLVILLAIPSFASSLIAQKTVVIDAQAGAVEVLRIDTAKYKQVRIGVALDREQKTKFDLSAAAFAVEGDNFIRLAGATGTQDVSFTVVTPPTLMSINLFGSGKFHIFIWAD